MMKMYAFVVIAMSWMVCLGGCQLFTGTSEEKAQVATHEGHPKTVAEWLKRAPNPIQMVCSLNVSEAPKAVSAFNSIAENVAKIYRKVYVYANEVHTNPQALPEGDAQKVAKLAQESNSKVWREEVQTLLTTRYQVLLKDIQTQERAIVDYTSNLRDDESIAAIEDPAKRTATLLRIGSDLQHLEEQLSAASEGASLVMRERLAMTLGED